jgi:hypothetical protein
MNLIGIKNVVAQIKFSPDELDIPKTANTDKALADGLQVFFGIAGAIALIVITVAGLQFVLSQGEPQKIAKARNTILYAIVGLVICILAFNIVGFVVGEL